MQESESANMSGYEMLEDDEHVFYQKTMEALALFEEGKSAIVYLPGMPRCEEAGRP
ncbi:MAG: hypothetical protein ACLVJ6_16075 [Merdibacter sp.]